jgi:hypothetical protein
MRRNNKIAYRVECGATFALLSVCRDDRCVRNALASLFPLMTESGSARMFHPAPQHNPPITLNPALPNSVLIETAPPDFEWLGNLLYNCMREEWSPDVQEEFPGKTNAEIGLMAFIVKIFPVRRGR